MSSLTRYSHNVVINSFQMRQYDISTFSCKYIPLLLQNPHPLPMHRYHLLLPQNRPFSPPTATALGENNCNVNSEISNISPLFKADETLLRSGKSSVGADPKPSEHSTEVQVLLMWNEQEANRKKIVQQAAVASRSTNNQSSCALATFSDHTSPLPNVYYDWWTWWSVLLGLCKNYGFGCIFYRRYIPHL